jgi:hypothetical protein
MVVVLPHDNASLRAFWNDFYLRGGPHRVASAVWHRSSSFHEWFGVPAIVLLTLVAIALACLTARRNIAVAAALPILWIEMIVLGIARRYPFLDMRTSFFLLVTTLVFGVIGVMSLISVLGQHLVRQVPLSMLVMLLLLVAAHTSIRAYYRPPEDPRAQAHYVAAHLGPEDVILVSEHANWGFAYYWPRHDRRRYVRDSTVAAAFVVHVDGIGATYIAGRNPRAIRTALQDAIAQWRRNGANGRIWIVRSHIIAAERESWGVALRQLELRPAEIPGMEEPVLVLDRTLLASAP